MVSQAKVHKIWLFIVLCRNWIILLVNCRMVRFCVFKAMIVHGAYGIWRLKRKSCIRRVTAWVYMTLPSIKMALWLALGKTSVKPGTSQQSHSFICLLAQSTGFTVDALFHQGPGCIWSSLGPAHRTLHHVPRRPPKGNLRNKFFPQWVNELADWGLRGCFRKYCVSNFDNAPDPQLPHCNWQWWQYLQSVGPSTAALHLYHPCPSELSDRGQVWA